MENHFQCCRQMRKKASAHWDGFPCSLKALSLSCVLLMRCCSELSTSPIQQGFANKYQDDSIQLFAQIRAVQEQVLLVAEQCWSIQRSLCLELAAFSAPKPQVCSHPKECQIN